MIASDILYPVLTIAGLGLFFGLGLGLAGKFLKVEEDPKIEQIRELLPGANCGGCGFAGCDAFASAIAEGKAEPLGCPVGGAVLAKELGEIMGVEVDVVEKLAAYIKCGGDCENSTFRYNYYGIEDCHAVQMLAGGGSKSCVFGCLGHGSCVQACKFKAIYLINGIAVVDNEKCTACGMCVSTCPRKLIELIPYKSEVRVACNSTDKGKIVKQNCTVGCIGCKLCEKACVYGAVHVENDLSRIDYEKCVLCGACVKNCPTKTIVMVEEIKK